MTSKTEALREALERPWGSIVFSDELIDAVLRLCKEHGLVFVDIEQNHAQKYDWIEPLEVE